MSRAVILTAAAVCGTVAFAWTLLAEGRRHHAVVIRGAAPFNQGARRGPNAMSIPGPHDLPGLEQWVTDNPADIGAWIELAQRRHAAGLVDEEHDAWIDRK